MSEKLAFVVRDAGDSSKSELSPRMLLLPAAASVSEKGLGESCIDLSLEERAGREEACGLTCLPPFSHGSPLVISLSLSFLW